MAFRRNCLAALITLAAITSLAATASCVPAARATPNLQTPAWASRGLIVYHCGDSLCLMRPDGSGARRLVAATQRRPWPQWDPAVSADGQVVAFRGYYGDDEGSYALYVVRADGCGLRRVTRSGAGNPSWSPDGRWIAFDTSGAGEIWKVHPDGSGLSRLIGGGEVRASSPVWSPNGARIAFVRSVPSGSQIWVTSANGLTQPASTRIEGCTTRAPLGRTTERGSLSRLSSGRDRRL